MDGELALIKGQKLKIYHFFHC